MKGNETILPKTEITTTYDENGNTITEVKEDYENNKITITLPEYYLTGSTQKPTQKPQIPEGEYEILIYQTNTASTPLIQKPINLIQMPFNLTFYHHDYLGTTRYITNENGEILHTTDTLAYGEELTAPYENDKDEVLNTITFTGHEKDYETGLTYMLARYYSQGYGRFLSPDPGYDYDQLDPMSWNVYSYVRGNPVKSLDPTGEKLILYYYVERKYMNNVEKSMNYKEIMNQVKERMAKTIKDDVEIREISNIYVMYMKVRATQAISKLTGDTARGVIFEHDEGAAKKLSEQGKEVGGYVEKTDKTHAEPYAHILVNETCKEGSLLVEQQTGMTIHEQMQNATANVVLHELGHTFNIIEHTTGLMVEQPTFYQLIDKNFHFNPVDEKRILEQYNEETGDSQ